jgi:surface antigen
MTPIRFPFAVSPVVWALVLTLVLPVMTPVMVSSAWAQMLPFPDSKGQPMSKADLEALTQATQRLNARNPAVVGATETWDGTVSGVVHLDRIYRAHDTMCHAVTYKLHRVSGGMRSVHMTWCKAPDGSWKTIG